MTTAKILALGAALSGLWLAPALAQTDNTTVQDWQSNCIPGGCFATRVVTRPSEQPSPTGAEQQQILGVLVVGVKPDGGGILGAVLPLGSAIKPGARLVYGDQTVNVDFEVCLPDGCRAVAEPTPEQFAAVQTADKVELLFFAQNNPQQFSIEIPTDGLSSVVGTLTERAKTEAVPK